MSQTISQLYQIKNIFEEGEAEGLVSRIDSLNSSSQRQWGTMSVAHMAEHCIQWQELFESGKDHGVGLVARLFGRMAVRSILRDSPLDQNIPTLQQLIVEPTADLETLKQKWRKLIIDHSQFKDASYRHPFFGKLSNEQMGQLIFKHNDHHLRQFNV